MISGKMWGDPIDEGAKEQLVRCAEHPAVRWAGMMADHHLGYSVPIGGVIAYENHISPSGVGFDIGCGNKAVKLDIPAREVTANIVTIMDDIFRNISFGMGQNNNTRVDHEMFHRLDGMWSSAPLRGLKDLAQNQLGTVGGGNHYVDLFIDDKGAIWCGVHFGSRGLGHKIATYFLKAGGAKDGIHAEPLVLPLDGGLGSEYIECMDLAGEYAYAGRDWVCSRVAEMLGAKIIDSVHNHHNFTWLEDGLWVVRKGSTPNQPGQRSFIGSSMGETSFIVEGLDTPEAKSSLNSIPHGAGRAMSRTAARGKTNRKTGELISQGAVSQHDMDDWLSSACVELRGGDLDEAPQAYKRLHEVLAHHSGAFTITNKLHPIGVAMAGRGTHDPYKD